MPSMSSTSIRGNEDDTTVLSTFFTEVAQKISDDVTRLMQRGQPLAFIAAFFERAFDGTVTGGCGHRAELAQRILSDHRFTDAVRHVVLDAFAAHDELPIVLLVDRGEGVVSVGVLRRRGELVAMS
jgi:hypothetical protein